MIAAVGALLQSGLLAPVRPDRIARAAAQAARLGPGVATIAAVSAVRWPEQLAIADEGGTLTYAQLDRRVRAIAVGLDADFGIGPGTSVAIMCRNHRGFVEALLAASRLGADVLLLNTDFPGAQLGQVLARERPGVVVLDAEFLPGLEAAGYDAPRVVGWHAEDPGLPTLEQYAAGSPQGAPSARHEGRLTILTSGTTGTPKGAPRKPSVTATVGPMVTLLQNIGLRTRESVLVSPPFFHGFGLAFLIVGLATGSRIVMQRRFDPEVALRAIDSQRVVFFAGVPVMLQRIVALDPAIRARYDTSSLRAAFAAGSQLPGAVSNAFMDAFGDIVHNGYGSSEVGVAALATPADLRAAPGTVGRAPLGVTVKLLGADRREVAAGEVGHIFAGSGSTFEGYTGGGNKEIVDGLMNTGDLGHVDAAGRLHVDGREDDMIVSGGENIFPQEVAEVLARHEAVADVAVFGVEDEEYGQRLRAYVVARADVTADELKAYVKTQLERFKAPRDVVFLDELPRSPTGKLSRQALEQAR